MRWRSVYIKIEYTRFCYSLLTDIIQYSIKYDSRNSAWLVNKPLLRGNNSLANYFYTISYRIISTSCQTKSHPQLPVIISLYLATYYSKVASNITWDAKILCFFFLVSIVHISWF